MPIAFYDVVGFFGIMLIVGSYFSLQTDRIAKEDLSYSLANGIGALCVLFSIAFQFNLSAFLVELFWVVISLIGIIRFFTRTSPKPPERSASDDHL
jgi:hypothetical protein